MKDLQLKDILKKPKRYLRGFSIYVGGNWVFSFPTNLVKTTLQQKFYLVSTPFGLVSETVYDPKKFSILGTPGDYVAENINTGTLDLVTPAQFSRLFPSPKQSIPTPTSSEMLKNPNYITKIQQESVAKDSNIQIGNKSFKGTSNKKQTPTKPKSNY
mgnify:CR=1 FL=1|tara:strand:- start:4158 stop:4628 length:471 start_codon:yes stop_codon:yes gene_type:complete